MPSHRYDNNGHAYRSGFVSGSGLPIHHAVDATHGAKRESNPTAVVAKPTLTDTEERLGVVYRGGYTIPKDQWEDAGRDLQKWKRTYSDVVAFVDSRASAPRR